MKYKREINIRAVARRKEKIENNKLMLLNLQIAEEEAEQLLQM